MNRVRLWFAGLTSILIAVGYLASQNAYLSGRAAEYSAQVDVQPIVLLSLFMFVAAIVLFIIKDKDQDPA